MYVERTYIHTCMFVCLYVRVCVMLESAGMNTYVNACVVLKGEKFVDVVMHFSQVVVVVVVCY